MFRKLVYFCSLMTIIPTYASLGPHILDNSPAEYLLDLDLTFYNPDTTFQIGNELYERNYINGVITYDSLSAPYNDRPTTPAPGYSFANGQWVWIPNSLNSTTGTWYWILRTRPYYITLLNSLVHPF